MLLELNSWRLIASCAKTAGGNPMTGPCYSSVICHIHDGGWSREAVARRPRLSVPSPQELVQNRTVEIHAADASSKSLKFLVGAVTTWNSRAAQKRSTVRRQASFYLLFEAFLEVMRLQPQPIQRWIARRNGGYRCSTACSAASGGALLHRVSSSTRDRHR